MGYSYENSGPERFQQLCQSLLVQDFPELQCYPIGQPDGGRDGWDAESKTVLQVKFKRKDENGTADWMIEALKKELPKIQNLVDRGAEKYLMATNARGSSHLDAGAIDLVQKWLDDNVPIPAICFWRDEIDRRIDLAGVSLKLKYSEIVSLEDGLEAIIDTALGGDKSRQKDAIRAFIANQYNTDKTVKFKQVSLSNNLLDLFIDVPIGVPANILDLETGDVGSASEVSELLSKLSQPDARYITDELDEETASELFHSLSFDLDRLTVGAAEVLLSDVIQSRVKLVVLEGAPGQGKSTLAQFVCQIHPSRYLRKLEVTNAVDKKYLCTGFRIPVKIDLRDYAKFLDGESPYVDSGSVSSPLTLDRFLGELIAHQSGGVEFSAYDVLNLLKEAPVLLFLDGLDEVADVAARENLVQSIGEALGRWSEFDTDVQVVITSRPSVFGRAPSFDKFGFVTLNLQNIDRARIDDYADRWMNARGLDSDERDEVKKILNEKLELAHIRELTRNPMQLTILLSLIHQVGHSLPDQRTDLYYRYVDLFLTREGDKSALVRAHRSILLGFIEYLAWVLQTQAESSKSSGSISAPDLQILARDYLTEGGHRTEIADDLFGGGLERIFVLVERIEGLYEFEVQPLREYYCAQYLYSTAPVGTYRDKALQGDRAHRFEALASNPFWMNVCRFYAGSCERGEVGTLVLSLDEMIRTGTTALSIHARRVGLALLQDWVFSNSKYPQEQLVQSVVSGEGLLLVSDNGLSASTILDVACGQDVFRDLVFSQLKTQPFGRWAAALCRILRANGGNKLQSEFLALVDDAEGSERTFQLVRMFRSGGAVGMTCERVWSSIVGDKPKESELRSRVSALACTEPEIAKRIPRLVDTYVDAVLNGFAVGNEFVDDELGIFSLLLGSSVPNFRLARRRIRMLDFENRLLSRSEDFYLPDSVREFLVSSLKLSSRNYPVNRHVYPLFWNDIAELARTYFGETWATYSIALKAAGVKFDFPCMSHCLGLFDEAFPVTFRARWARLKRARSSWWLGELSNASSPVDKMFWVAMVVSWSSPDVLDALKEVLEYEVAQLSEDSFNALRESVSVAMAVGTVRVDRRRTKILDLSQYSDRLAVLLAIGFSLPTSRLMGASADWRKECPLIDAYLKAKELEEEVVKCPSWKDREGSISWAKNVAKIENCPSSGILPIEVFQHLIDAQIDSAFAEQILADPADYPRQLISRALHEVESQYRPDALAVLAVRDCWTFG